MITPKARPQKRDLHHWLDKVEDKYPQIRDMAVREELSGAIDYFIFDSSGGEFPLNTHFAMFSDEGNEEVRKALLQFLTHPEVKAARVELTTPQARLDAFQDGDVESSNGSTYDNYFGWSDRLYPR